MAGPGHASLDSIELLKDLRVALIAFAEESKASLGEAEADIGRQQQWLANQGPYWQGQVKRIHHQLNQAKEEFRKKILYKDASGRPQSAVEEKKAVTVLQRKLEEAEGRLKNVERWRRQVDQEAINYRGAVQLIMRAAEYDVPQAVAFLDRLADNLDRYLATTGPTSGDVGAAGDASRFDAGETSMARPVTEASTADEPAASEEPASTEERP